MEKKNPNQPQPIDLTASSSRWLQRADRLNSSAWTYVQPPTPPRADGANCRLRANQTQHPREGSPTWGGELEFTLSFGGLREGASPWKPLLFCGWQSFLKNRVQGWSNPVLDKPTDGISNLPAESKEPFCGLKLWLLEDAIKVARSGTYSFDLGQKSKKKKLLEENINQQHQVIAYVFLAFPRFFVILCERR